MNKYIYPILFFITICFSSFCAAQPVVNLGNDTSTCAASIQLNAGNPTASFLWNTGATTQTITVSNSGTYSVTVSDMSGSGSDAVLVNFVPTPTFIINDTNLCAGVNTLTINGLNGVLYNWYDAATGGNLLNIGQTLTVNFSTSRSYFIEAANVLNTRLGGGLANFLVGGGSNYYNINTPRGLVFDITQPVRLSSVQIPAQGGTLTATLQIFNNANQLVYNQPNINLVAGFNTVIINQDFNVGTGFRIMLDNIVGSGQLHVSAGGSLVYPMNNGPIRLTSGYFNGAPTTGQYNFFYNFMIPNALCATPRDEVQVTVNPSPALFLPNDTSTCAGSLGLNAFFPNATYLWNNNATTSAINATTSGLYAVTVTAAGCSTVDSSRVLVSSTPNFTINDTTVCSGVNTLTINGLNGVLYNWYDAATGGNLLNIGQTLTANFNNSRSYFIQAANVVSTQNGGGLSNFLVGGGSGYYNINTPRGLVFDITQPVRLSSVQIPVQNGTLTATVQIFNNANQLVYNQPNINLVAGFNTVIINQDFNVGTGFRIMLTNIVGSGQLHVSAGGSLVYPMNNGAIRLTSGYFNGAPTTGQYNFFYNFMIPNALCATPRDEVQVSVTISPSVNFPNDTTVCGQSPLILDASNANSTYLWSTGETTPSISLFQTDRVWAQVLRGNCLATDTVQAYLLDTAQFIANDTTFCAGLHTVSIQGGNNFSYFWWNAPTAGNIQNEGLSFTQNFTNSATYHIQGQSARATFFEGLVDNQQINGSGSAFYNITDTRGMTFTALSNFLLKSVLIYADGLVNGQVELQQTNGAVIYSKNISLVSGANRVQLNFPVSAGNYRIVLRNPTGGGQLFADAPDAGATYPLNYQHIRLTATIVNNNVVTAGYVGQIYNHFYNWEIVETACPTARYPLAVNILPTPVLNLPVDTVICGLSVGLNANHPNNTNAAYAWTTGETTAQIVVNQSNTYAVTATIGQCEVVDTCRVEVANPPTFVQAPNDTTVCGGTLTLRATTDGFLPAWYADSNSLNPLIIADSIVYNATVDDTIWVAGLGFMPKLNTYGQTSQGQVFPTNYVSPRSMYATRGLEFDVRTTIKLDQVSIFIDSAAARAKIILLDRFGFVRNSLWANLAVGENIVNLDWVILSDAGYKIVLDSISGGKPYANFGSFPMVYPEMVIQRGYPAVIGSFYNYFFKLKISTPSCATLREPVRITVPPFPVLTIPTDTAICNNPAPITLTATANNPNYTYRWQTGATSNNFIALSSGYYSVTVTNQGLCSVSQNVLVQYLSTPSAPNVSDMDICSSQQMNLLQSNSNQIYNWFNINGLQTYINAPYSVYVRDTTDFIVENAARAQTRLGAQAANNPQNLNLYNNFIIPNTFNVLEWTVLDSVAVYLETAPATFQVVLRNSAGQIINSKTVTVNNARTKTFLNLGFSLAPANGYQLQFANINSRFLVNPTPSNSSNGSNIAVLTGTNLAGVNYPCFFDWHFGYALAGCVSAADTFRVAVRLPLILPDTAVFVCDSYLADASAAFANSYLWSNGATTDTTTLRQAGIYTVTISDGAACVGVDTVQISKPMPVGLPTNGISCERLLVSNYSNVPNASFLWSIGATTSTLLIPDTASYRLTVTTPEGCVLVDSAHITQIERVPFFDLGLNRNICVGDTLFDGTLAENSGISYQWSTGSTARFIIINNSGLYTITSTTPNGCTATDAVIITAQNPPIANFLVFYQQNLSVGLNNLSQNFDTYYYDYGVNTGGTSSAFYTYDTAGCYNIRLFVQSACGEDSTSRWVAMNSNCDTTAVEEIFYQKLAFDFEIYPNPNQGYFNIKANQIAAESQIFIYNAQGQLVYNQLVDNQSLLNIAIPNLSKGLYYLRWVSPQISQSKTFIISN